MADKKVSMPPNIFQYGPIDASLVTSQDAVAGSKERDVKETNNGTKDDSLSVSEGSIVGKDGASEPLSESIRSHQKLLEAFETQKSARYAAAPTIDNEVKQRLRDLGEPICLFGEGPFERRERLRFLLTKRTFKQEAAPEILCVDSSKLDAQPKLFFSEGGPELLNTRRWIARYSLPRAVKRLRRDRQEYDATDPIADEARVAAHNRQLRDKLCVAVSQVGSERPLTAGRFSPNGAYFATASWSPVIRLWELPYCCDKRAQQLQGHEERVNCLAWSPFFSSSLSPGISTASTPRGMDNLSSDVQSGNLSRESESATYSDGIHLASGGADSTLHLWSLTTGRSVAKLEGHEERVNRVEFHPSGRFLASTSHDETWRLWDLTTCKEILTQEGHSSGVYSIKMHPDGSLVLTGDLGGIVRCWDLRTGRTVFPLLGHVKQVLGITINPRRRAVRQGYWLCSKYILGLHLCSSCAGPNQVATCSDDNTVRIWDIRKQRCVDMILAHDKLISDVAFEVWNANDFSCSRSLLGHEGRVTGADISEGVVFEACLPFHCAVMVLLDGGIIASVSFDRTFKLWTTQDALDSFDPLSVEEERAGSAHEISGDAAPPQLQEPFNGSQDTTDCAMAVAC